MNICNSKIKKIDNKKKKKKRNIHSKIYSPVYERIKIYMKISIPLHV